MNKKILLFSLLSLVPFTSAHALAVSAETKPFLDVNYSENVLNTLLSQWRKPQIEVTGVTAITIRLAKDGRPYSCEIRHHSSSPDVDNSLCQTVSQIGQFSPLKASDNGEVYLTFVHDNTPFLQAKNEEITDVPAFAPEIAAGSAMSGQEQVDTVRNSVNTPIREIQKSTQVDVESSSIVEESVPLQPVPTPTPVQNTQIIQNTQTAQAYQTTKTVNNTQTNTAVKTTVNNTANTVALPIATEPQPQTIRISREEALQAPSANLADPAQFVQAYSQDILRQASPKIRIPSSISGKYQVIARIDVLGEGKLKNVKITKSSQNPIIDNEILRVLSHEIRYAPLPHSEQSMWLTFNITK